MSTTADILVVGLGAVGSAALYQAAKHNARVIGIDRFSPPHEFGSSHGETRITRQAIGEGRDYVQLVLRSHEIWEELERVTGRNLLTRSGVLILASPHTAGDHHGSTSFLDDTIAIARENNIAHEVLTTADIRSRYPQFQLNHEEVGYFEPGAGFVRPETCIETQFLLAQVLGAGVHTGETVLKIEPTTSSVEVTTDRATYSAGKVILSAGAWIPRLLPQRIAQHLHVYRQVLSWFAVSRHHELYTPERFPVFIWITGPEPKDMMYGFPPVDSVHNGVKVATEQYLATVNPDEVDRTVSPAEIEALHTHYIAPHFPDVSSQCVRSAVCLYTVAPHARFVIDAVDPASRILFASACSGHGFKHSAAIGEALTRQALGLPPLVDLAPFSADRLDVPTPS